MEEDIILSWNVQFASNITTEQTPLDRITALPVGCNSYRQLIELLENVDMAEIPQYLLIVNAEIEEEVEADWNKWYDEVHLPDALACPGVLSGTRYVSSGSANLTKDGQKSQSSTKNYMSIYELSGPEALDTPEFSSMRGWYQYTDKITSRTQVFQRR